MAECTIGVMLGVYKKSRKYLDQQIEAVFSQTMPPKDVRVFNDGGEHVKSYNNVTVINSDTNLGIWERFYNCISMNTTFVAVFDDDTIPGRKWFKNCFYTHCITHGLVGAGGTVFNQGSKNPSDRTLYASRVPPKHGPRIQHPHHMMEVDMVGHCWFFPHSWLKNFVEMPRFNCPIAGENYHFSACVQKMGLKTWVPAHPIGMQEYWGCTLDEPHDVEGSLWKLNESEPLKTKCHNYYRNMGWRTIKEITEGDLPRWGL